MNTVIKIIVFQIGTQTFGIEIHALKGILSAEDIANHSNGKISASEKVITVNNQVVPVLDLHNKLQIPPLPSGQAIFLLLSSDKRTLAVPVDKTENIYDIPCYDLHPVPLAAQNGANRIINNIAVLEERLIPLFMPENLHILLGKTEEAARQTFYR